MGLIYLITVVFLAGAISSTTAKTAGNKHMELVSQNRKVLSNNTGTAVDVNGAETGNIHKVFAVNPEGQSDSDAYSRSRFVEKIAESKAEYINVPADYPTIPEAFAAANEGDVILVAPGTYSEPIVFSEKSVTLASWILTTGDTSYISQTVLDGSDGSAVITIEKTVGPSMAIKGFTIQNASDGISPHAKFEIRNCRIINCSDGIDYENGSGGICKENVFENNSDDGIDLDNAVDIEIEDNIIRNNKDDGIEIRLQSYNGVTLNCFIRNNKIYGNGEDGIQLIGYDVLTDRLFLIERNLIFKNKMAGLGCMGNSNTNETYEGASVLERIYLLNNTFASNAYGITGGDSLVAVNNIFVMHAGTAMKNVDGGSVVSFGMYWNNGADFENCNLDNPRIFKSDPLLDNGLNLQSASPAIDAGTGIFLWQGDTVLNLPADRYSGAAPDLGAIEYNSSSISSIIINDITVNEPDSNSVEAIFTVLLSPPSTQTVTVDYETMDGTATAPDDYTPANLSTLTFLPGTTSNTIPILIKGDTLKESTESFYLTLSNAINATIVDNEGVATIIDNDVSYLIRKSFQNGFDGYDGTRDTKLLSETPNNNFGSDAALEVDGSPGKSSLLYWDLSAIPINSPIQSAEISLNITGKSDSAYEFYQLRRPWKEDEASWNEYALGHEWLVAGANGPDDRDSTVLGRILAVDNGLHSISLNAAGIRIIQSWVNNPELNHGFIIQDYINNTDGLDFSSREADVVSNRPKLTVTYSSSDLPDTLVQVVRGPYLQIGTPTSLVVRWRTEPASVGWIRYGTDAKDLNTIIFDSPLAIEHEIDLSGLLPNTKYYYAIGSQDDTLSIGSDFFFVTAPPFKFPKKSRIWVLGDAGTADSKQAAVRDAYYTFTGNIQTDLWVMLGDNAYKNGSDSDYQAAVFDMYPKMLEKSVLWPAFGNHDGQSASSATQTGAFYDIFTLPSMGEAGGVASETEAYYSFNYANIHFICLNSDDIPRDKDGEMLTWLKNDLAANTMDWAIAFWHHPPYSKGSHDSDSASQLIEMRTNALPILEDGGVDLVLTGHSHSYERSYLLNEHYGDSSTLVDSMIIDRGDGRMDGDSAYHKPDLGPVSHEGTVYVVAGSSGKTGGGSLDHPAMYISLNMLGSVVLDVDSNRIDLTFLDDTGRRQDYFTMVKGKLDGSADSNKNNPANAELDFQLRQNYPNPFNPGTRISYSLPHPTFVTLKIYDILGREVRTLVNKFQIAGTHVIDFDARGFSSGQYFFIIKTSDGFVKTRKMSLLK